METVVLKITEDSNNSDLNDAGVFFFCDYYKCYLKYQTHISVKLGLSDKMRAISVENN